MATTCFKAPTGENALSWCWSRLGWSPLSWSKLPTPNGASLWVRRWRDHPTSIPSLLPSYAAIESSYQTISMRKVTFTFRIWMKSLMGDGVAV